MTSMQPSAVMTPEAGQAPLVETTGVPGSSRPVATTCFSVMPEAAGPPWTGEGGDGAGVVGGGQVVVDETQDPADRQDAGFEHSALERGQGFVAGTVAVVQVGDFGGSEQVIEASFEPAHLDGVEAVRGVSLDQQGPPPVVLGAQVVHQP